MAIERAVGGSERLTRSLPAARPLATRRADLGEVAGSSSTAGRSFVLDEAIDIRLGVDRQTGHLVIAGGDVRVEARPAGGPEPGTLGTPDHSDNGRPIGSLVNFVA